FFYVYSLTGDAFGYITLKEKGWNNRFSNPIDNVTASTNSSGIIFLYYLTTIVLITPTMLSTALNHNHKLFTLISAIALLFVYPDPHIYSVPRYWLMIFPIYISFSEISKNKWVDDLMTYLLLIFQPLFMVVWSSGSGYIV
ncbi:MAG: hypothetical protein KKD39_07795, partial [Candidatus Altiarchaeota archaeon]|nr:hypothetical protein [Candidatus Altiarchaeota archaeon]